jgi:hypothetical protein
MRFYPDLAQLFLVLEGAVPPVWRRVHVSFFTKLGGLHRVIQAVMDWDDRVPHRFILAGDILKRVAPGEVLDAKRERNWRLDSAFYPDKTFWYCYGGSDDWRLRVELEDYVDGEPHWRYPRCVGGEGASPPRLDGTFSVASANRRMWRSLKRR